MNDEGETKTRLVTLKAPYGREVRLDDVRFESGMRLMRVIIREGQRFTLMDIDAATAKTWGEAMTRWAAEAEVEPAPETEPEAGA
jgi:hypothetical protein